MSAKQQIGRLALRVDGENWIAYYAMLGTMDRAIMLGSIRMSIVTKSPARKQEFMDLMQEVVADLIEEAVGERPNWNRPQGAPENERSGNA